MERKADILRLLRIEAMRQTNLMWKASIPYVVMLQFLKELETAKAVGKEGPFYYITDKGREALKHYDLFAEAINEESPLMVRLDAKVVWR